MIVSVDGTFCCVACWEREVFGGETPCESKTEILYWDPSCPDCGSKIVLKDGTFGGVSGVHAFCSDGDCLWWDSP